MQRVIKPTLAVSILQFNAFKIAHVERGWKACTELDADFYSCLPNGCLQILGFYVSLVPCLRYDHEHAQQYSTWAMMLALTSFVLSVSSIATYPIATSISPLLDCFGGVFHVYVVLHLALKFDERLTDVEMRGEKGDKMKSA